MSTSWRVKNKEERRGKVGKKKKNNKKKKKNIFLIKWNKINDRMNEIK